MRADIGIITIAEDRGFDLTKANEKQADHGRHGSQEGDIILDICFALHKYETQYPLESEIEFVYDELVNWGYDSDWNEFNKVEKLRNQYQELENLQFSIKYGGKPLISWIDSMDEENPEKFSCMIDFEKEPKSIAYFRQYVDLEKALLEIKKKLTGGFIQ